MRFTAGRFLLGPVLTSGAGANVRAILELNAFNHVNFVPVGGIGNAIANYRVTGLNGANTSRVVQSAVRVNW